MRPAGRKPQVRAYDALVTTVALSQGVAVHTGNPADFTGIDGLEVAAIPLPG